MLMQGANEIVRTSTRRHSVATTRRSPVHHHVDHDDTNIDAEAAPKEQHIADDVDAMAQAQPKGGKINKFDLTREERLARMTAHNNVSRVDRMKKYVSKLKLRQQKHIQRLQDKKRKRLDRIAERCPCSHCCTLFEVKLIIINTVIKIINDRR